MSTICDGCKQLQQKIKELKKKLANAEVSCVPWMTMAPINKPYIITIPPPVSSQCTKEHVEPDLSQGTTVPY